MMALVVIGWLVIAALAGFAMVATLFLTIASLRMTGKVQSEILAVAFIALLLVWVASYTWPFKLSIAVVGPAL